jgi:hypothetical protein
MRLTVYFDQKSSRNISNEFGSNIIEMIPVARSSIERLDSKARVRVNPSSAA